MLSMFWNIATSAPTASKILYGIFKILDSNTGSKSNRTQWILIQREQTTQLWKAGTMGELHPHGSSQWYYMPLMK